MFLNSLAFAFLIKGEAYVDGKLSYIEKHEAVTDSKGKYLLLKTDYVDAQSQKKFAEISSNFKNNYFIPDVIFQDSRFNLVEKISYQKEINSIEVSRVFPNKSENYVLKLERPAILGQGFHNFIVENFDQILNNQMNVHFVITSKKDQYNFRVEKLAQNNDMVEIKVYPNNFILKQFVSPILLKYTIKDKRLLSFKGLSNLDNNKGDSQEVDIKYYY